jgi:hypothetical protein
MRPIKFDLIVDRVPCYNFETLQENFNILDIVAYFESGKLEKWLTARNMNELTAVQAIDKSENKIVIAKALCAVFQMEVSEVDLTDNMMALDCYQQQKNDIDTIKALFEQYAANRKPKVNEVRIGNYIVRDDGIVIDTTNNLMWCRFLVGQDWQDGEVSGEAKKTDWKAACDSVEQFNSQGGYAGYTDWRLPTDDERNNVSYYSYEDEEHNCSDIFLFGGVTFAQRNCVGNNHARLVRGDSVVTKPSNLFGWI